MRYAKTFFAALALTLVAAAATTTPAAQNLANASIEFSNGDILIIIGDTFIAI